MSKPEIIENFYENGQLMRREFRVNDRLHRDPIDGPAYEYFYDNGQVMLRIHRYPEGSASESFYDNGQVILQEFYVNGVWVEEPKESTDL